MGALPEQPLGQTAEGLDVQDDSVELALREMALTCTSSEYAANGCFFLNKCWMASA